MIRKTVLFLNAIFAIGLFLSGLDQLIGLDSLSLIHFLNLLVPLLVGINLFFLVFWFVFKRSYTLLSLLVLFFALFAFEPFLRLFGSHSDTKAGDFNILTLNAHTFDGPKWTGKSGYKDKIINFVAEQNADIICLQEFQYLDENELPQYPYRYLNHFSERGKRYLRQIIYSKCPMVEKG
ncbi:MAG: hypothetical protein AAFX53_14635, partial [Bacteroidota bacterium]